MPRAAAIIDVQTPAGSVRVILPAPEPARPGLAKGAAQPRRVITARGETVEDDPLATSTLWDSPRQRGPVRTGAPKPTVARIPLRRVG